MFDDFDYKKGAKGAGGLLKGVVKAISPESGAGMDEAGGGLGDILAAAGVQLDDEPTEQKPTKPQKAKSPGRAFDEHDFNRPAPVREVIKFRTPEGDDVTLTSTPTGDAPTDREATAALLRDRGWSEAEIKWILAGPTAEANRANEAKAERKDGEAASTDERAAISNAGAPARRVQPAKAQRITR